MQRSGRHFVINLRGHDISQGLDWEPPSLSPHFLLTAGTDKLFSIFSIRDFALVALVKNKIESNRVKYDHEKDFFHLNLSTLFTGLYNIIANTNNNSITLTMLFSYNFTKV